MREICRDCPDKYTVVCELPSLMDRLEDTVLWLGARIVTSLYTAAPVYGGPTVESSSPADERSSFQLRQAGIEACIRAHSSRWIEDRP